MANENDLNASDEENQELEGPTPETKDDELLAKFDAVLTQNQQLLGKLDAAEEERKSEQVARERAERLARQHQSNYDALHAKTSMPLTKPNETQDQLNAAVRENEFLRELDKRGLTLKEVEGVIDLDEINSRTELRLTLDVFAQKKEIEQLQESKKEKPETPPSSESPIDAGGPSGTGASTNASKVDYKELDKEYARIRSIPNKEEARLKMLDLIHRDPRKVIKEDKQE